MKYEKPEVDQKVDLEGKLGGDGQIVRGSFLKYEDT